MSDSPGTPDPTTDPEILPLLDFTPVPRRFEREDGWTPALQRLFIAHLALTGSPGKACDALGKRRSGIDKLSKLQGSESFRAAWGAAVALAQERNARSIAAGHSGAADIKLPFIDHRRKSGPQHDAPLPGQVRNEHGEWEDEASLQRRGEEARDSISRKILNCRRWFLREISCSPGKRAAFEILTELPIDWGKAERLEPQADEPWRKPNMRSGDMVLMAENGWMPGVHYGPDKIGQMRRAIDEHRAEQGLPPVDWDEDAGGSD